MGKITIPLMGVSIGQEPYTRCLAISSHQQIVVVALAIIIVILKLGRYPVQSGHLRKYSLKLPAGKRVPGRTLW